jgi:UDPglucose 6-dehydrogenase
VKIAVVGTGYVGLVTGTCMAEVGNDVTCIDINKSKVAAMRQGKIPIYEPGLEDMFQHNINKKRIAFTSDLRNGIKGASVIFLALPTPPDENGSADLSYVLGVAENLGKILRHYTIIVNKSTVPVGTAAKVRKQVSKHASVKFDVVSNPEFLREGSAVDDFMKPDRVVIGSSSSKATKIMRELYRPFVRRNPEALIVTDEPSAEMIKYAANAFLATKITFVNELAKLCEVTGADIEMVRIGMGSDSRIGAQFLYPGPGYGGSCFPKDTLALQNTAHEYGLKLGIVSATIEANYQQQKVVAQKVLNYYKNNVAGRTFALWGLAFKDNTDDVRESPALEILKTLTSANAKVIAFDPQATENVKRVIGDNKNLSFVQNEYDALKNADALIIATNWKEFFDPDFARIKKLLKTPVIFDGRNLYDPNTMKETGFYYESIGRTIVNRHV